MKVIRCCVLALAGLLACSTGGSVLADAPNQLPEGSDVTLSLPAGGSSTYSLNPSSGGTLAVQLASGDVSLSLQSDDQSSSIQDSLMGAGTASIGLQGLPYGQTFQLQLTSQGGAQMTLNFASGGGVPGVSVTSVSSSSGSSVTSTAQSSVSVSSSQQVSVSGGGRIEINNGQVTVNGGP